MTIKEGLSWAKEVLQEACERPAFEAELLLAFHLDKDRTYLIMHDIEDITNVDGVSISHVNNNFLRRDGTNATTGSVNMTGNTLTNVADLVNAHDVATKNYVDSAGVG